jgi:hypothetical protein
VNHLEETNMTYFQHLKRAWSIAGVLLVHGMLPNVWKNKASDMLCQNHVSSTRKKLLDFYGVSQNRKD